MMGRGWFKTAGRDGDRTLAEQMIGLEPLIEEIRGKRVLDFGCAEGLIGMELLNRGAAGVTGFDSVEDHIKVGKTIALDTGIDIELQVGNLNDYAIETLKPVDVVLLLAILHKLRDPSAFAARAAALATDQVVVRLPPSGPVIRDARSGYAPHDIGAVLTKAGFTLAIEQHGFNDEWIGYFRRPRAAVAVPIEPAAAPVEPPAASEPAAEPIEPPAAPAEPEKSEATVVTDDAPAEEQTAEQTAETEPADASTEVQPMTTETVTGRRRAKRTGE